MGLFLILTITARFPSDDPPNVTPLSQDCHHKCQSRSRQFSLLYQDTPSRCYEVVLEAGWQIAGGRCEEHQHGNVNPDIIHGREWFLGPSIQTNDKASDLVL